MSKIKVTQIKSVIGRNQKVRDTIISLGLNKISRSKIHEDNKVIRGMIDKVSYLVTVEKVK